MEENKELKNIEDVNIKDVVDILNDEYDKMKSICFLYDEDDNKIIIRCKRAYGNVEKASGYQVDYIKTFDNIEWRSTSNLMKSNKWCASAIISSALKFENITFKVII